LCDVLQGCPRRVGMGLKGFVSKHRERAYRAGSFTARDQELSPSGASREF